jgi:tetratricopeptide (TPR) repeat protein
MASCRDVISWLARWTWCGASLLTWGVIRLIQEEIHDRHAQQEIVMTTPTLADRELLTTDGTIAVANLHAQISDLAGRAGLAGSAQAAAASPAVADQAALIDLLLLRGDVLGRISDYEQAAELAGQLVRDAPNSATAWLARVRTHAIFRRIGEALDDLDTAGRRGCDQATMNVERAAILQMAGCYWHALVLGLSAARQRPSFTTLGALAVLHAEHGEVVAAEPLFAEARRRYQGASPFPIASLDHRQGLMWQSRGNLRAARAWFSAAERRVPAYAPTLGHLGQVDAALGAHADAIARLRPLASFSDDPQYAASLSRVLAAAGYRRDARRWRFRAAARYAELNVRHPGAFADHAAAFRRQADDETDLLADAC